jgi:hypothetical protein
MTNVIDFQSKARNASPAKPAGQVDVFSEGHGMVLFEGCVPTSVMSAILALLGTAGVAITHDA